MTFEPFKTCEFLSFFFALLLLKSFYLKYIFITKMLYKVTTALHLKQYLTDGQVRNQMSLS